MTGAAQNKLGELFVDIGVGGVGKTIKSLNSISASFLLTKNAAMQAIKPFINIGKEAMNSAVGIGKMAAALGTTALNAQRLQYYLKTYDSQGLEGSVASLQSIFTRLKAGYGGLDGQMAMSMGQLGLDWQKYSGSFEDTLQFIQDVKDRFKQGGFSENEKLMHLQNLGLQEWKYLFEKEDFDINESLRISEETIENLQKGAEATNEMKNNMDQFGKNVSNFYVTHGALNAIKDINKAFEGDNAAKTKTVVRGSAVTAGALSGGLAGTMFGPLGTAAGVIIGGTAALAGNEAILNKLGYNKNLESIPTTEPIYTSDVSNGALPSLTNASGQALQVNVNTEVKSKDPQSTEFTVLDINVEPIHYTQAMQRNIN
jgi:hypothetical protein